MTSEFQNYFIMSGKNYKIWNISGKKDDFILGYLSGEAKITVHFFTFFLILNVLVLTSTLSMSIILIYILLDENSYFFCYFLELVLFSNLAIRI